MLNNQEPLRDSLAPLFPPTNKQGKQKAALLKAVEKHTAAAEAAKRRLAEEGDGVDADAPRGAFAEVSKLGSCKRGAQVALKVKASYGGYTFGNVGRLCSAVDAKQIKLAWLHPAHELHDPSTMNVPRATIAKWLRDDHETMQLFGLRGVPGERHWKVERDVRRRTSLDSAGGHLGTGGLGKAEEGLMV